MLESSATKRIFVVFKSIQGWFMSSSQLIRVAVAGIALWLMASGFSAVVRNLSQRNAGSAASPRLIEVPTDVHPIGSATQANYPRELARSAAAQYEQLQAPQEQTEASASAARIRNLTAAPSATAGWPIREPALAPAPIAETARPSRQSQFIPIAMPEPAATPAGEAVAALRAAADFSGLAGQGAGAPHEGPQLKRPEGPVSDAAGASVEQTANRESKISAQPVATSTPIGRAAQVAPPPSAPPAAQASGRPLPSAGMQVVNQRAMQMAEQATAMANRGMLYSAHTELIQSLALIAQALDVQAGGGQHEAALNAGITALAEAREFSATRIRAGEAVEAGSIAAGHRTPVLRGSTNAGLSAIVAQQQYFGYAQSQLVQAAGGVPAGSQILYRLGRLQTAIAGHDADPLALHGPQAIVFHQAALATDRTNWLAANELGVLYARYGQLAEARQLLLHSVSVRSNLEGWHNLSVVHRRLGEAELAHKANTEWELLAKHTGKTRTDTGEMVRWVDPKTFASGNATDARWPASTAAKPATAAQGGVRR